MRIGKLFLFGLLCVTGLSACDHMARPYMREETADRLASPAWMIKRAIPTGQFSLMAYERMHEHNVPATVYIEGDGELRSDFNIDSKDPTPRNPVALHLATRDKSENVVYLGRPCQYVGAENCKPEYWGERRYSPEVLAAYNTALDEIKKRYDIRGYHLVGFDGGGTIAAILTAQRGDVLTLRTVAGNLDPATYSTIHGIPPLFGSMNPSDFASKLANIPQAHYIGGQDEIIPPAILHSYLQALGPTNCVQYRFIQEAEHTKGWVDKWPEFLAEAPTCRGPVKEMEYAPMPEPHVRIQPETPDKK